jgi:hypothetical protein
VKDALLRNAIVEGICENAFESKINYHDKAKGDFAIMALKRGRQQFAVPERDEISNVGMRVNDTLLWADRSDKYTRKVARMDQMTTWTF